MAYTNVYPSRINWNNSPNTTTPLNATNLNKIDYALRQIDGTLENWDTAKVTSTEFNTFKSDTNSALTALNINKASKSEILSCVKSIDYNDSTGEFVFTWQDNTTKTVDLNIEKIPVSFSMTGRGIVVMTTADGTTFSADISSAIKPYSFNDSNTINFISNSTQSTDPIQVYFNDEVTQTSVLITNITEIPDTIKIEPIDSSETLTITTVNIRYDTITQTNKSGNFNVNKTTGTLNLYTSIPNLIKIRSITVNFDDTGKNYKIAGYLISKINVTADIINGSITPEKLQTNFLGDCVSAKNDAKTAATNSANSSVDSEAWSKGTRNGLIVESTDPTFHNNSKWYAEKAQEYAEQAQAIADIDIATDTVPGLCRPDNTTIIISNGVLSAVGVGVSDADWATIQNMLNNI